MKDELYYTSKQHLLLNTLGQELQPNEPFTYVQRCSALRKVEGGEGRFGTSNIHLRVRICVHTVSMQDTAVSAQGINAMARVTLAGNCYERQSQLYNKLHHYCAISFSVCQGAEPYVRTCNGGAKQPAEVWST